MKKYLLLLVISLVPLVSAWGGHTLNSGERQVLKDWLKRHPTYRQATDEDCDCAGNIQDVRQGSGGELKPLRDYHPYTATGDFNGDGAEDFAVVLIDRTKKQKNFVLVVFNGPFTSETPSPAFMQSGMDLKYFGLFYGPPRPKPYRLVLGPFNSDSGALLIPRGRSYRLEDSEDE